jgi:hypothetical protein
MASDLLPKRALPLSADLPCKSPAGHRMSRQFLLQLLELIGLRLDFSRHQFADCAQLSGVFGQGFERRVHAYFISEQPSEWNTKCI